MKVQVYWHIHHTKLFELNTEPITNRRKYIKANKPVHEIATRLRLLKPVKNPPLWITAALEESKKLEAIISKSRAKTNEMLTMYRNHRTDSAKYVEQYLKHDALGERYEKTLDKIRYPSDRRLKEMNKLHNKECPNCPWNGSTIFPRD